MAKKLSEIESIIKSKENHFFNFLEEILDKDVFNFIESLSMNTNVYLFSGIIRNYFLNNLVIRDVDIVIESDEEIQLLLDKYEYRRNSFGGYKIIINNMVIDVWRIDRTWAINNHQTILNFDLDKYIPHTAFFNFSAIIYSINRKKFIYTIHFLRFLRDKKMDIVYVPNANYHLCVVNCFYYSDKYNLKISKKLGETIIKIFLRIDKNYNEVQEKHFGEILYNNVEIEDKINDIVENLKVEFVKLKLKNAGLKLIGNKNGREGVDFLIGDNQIYLQPLDLDTIKQSIKISKQDLGELNDNLFIALVLIIEKQPRVFYVIPSKQLLGSNSNHFVNNEVNLRHSLSNWEIKISSKSIEELEKYALKNMTGKLKA